MTILRYYFYICIKNVSHFCLTSYMKKKPTKDKHRINVDLPAEIYEQFKVMAKEESRSMTNFASVLIRRHVIETLQKKNHVST